MRSNHYQFQLVANHSIGQEILNAPNLELVNKHALEITFFFFTKGRVLHYAPYLLIQNPLLLLLESAILSSGKSIMGLIALFIAQSWLN